VRGRERVSRQRVRRGHRVHRDPGVLLVRDRLSEHQVRVRVDAPAAGVEAVEERVHRAGVRVAERGRPERLLGAGRRPVVILGHQGLDGETPLGCWLEHGPVVPVPGRRSNCRAALWL